MCDSISKLVTEIPNTVVIPFPGSTIWGLHSEFCSNTRRFSSYQVILLHVGTNDADHFGSTPALMLRYLKRLVASFLSLPQKPVVVLSAILPRPKDFSKTNSKIEEYNDSVRVWAKTEQKVQYVKSFLPFFRIGVLRTELFEPDGLHLNSKGVLVLRDYFCKVLTPFRETTAEWREHPTSLIGIIESRRTCTDISSRLGSIISVEQSSHGFPRRKDHTCGPASHSKFFVPEGGVAIQGEHDPASNFWREDFWFRGLPFVSGEQCYQYFKALFNGDRGKADQVVMHVNPRKIKSIGKEIWVTDPHWQQRRCDLMWEMLQAKLAQSTSFIERLRETGNAPLFHTVQDEFWGSCVSGGIQSVWVFVRAVTTEKVDWAIPFIGLMPSPCVLYC